MTYASVATLFTKPLLIFLPEHLFSDDAIARGRRCVEEGLRKQRGGGSGREDANVTLLIAE